MTKPSSLIVILALLATSLPAVVWVGVMPVGAQATGPVPGWDVGCVYVASEPIDPIVKKDLSDSDHLHDLFGAHITRTSDYQALRAANADNCTYLDDEAGYWTPALYDRNNNQVFPRHAHAYYRVAVGTDPVVIQPWPQGLEVVAGSHAATGPQYINDNPKRRKVVWFCGGAAPAAR